MPLSEQQRHHLEQRLKEERDRLRRDLKLAETDQATDDQDRAGNLSVVPIHPADLGTDTFDDELEISNAERMASELREIDAALSRLYEHPDRFGTCEDTGKPIPLERLEIVPWARTCAQAGAPAD
jgi:RNA polymerase-binding transcription factor DksA